MYNIFYCLALLSNTYFSYTCFVLNCPLLKISTHHLQYVLIIYLQYLNVSIFTKRFSMLYSMSIPVSMYSMYSQCKAVVITRVRSMNVLGTSLRKVKNIYNVLFSSRVPKIMLHYKIFYFLWSQTLPYSGLKSHVSMFLNLTFYDAG